MRRYTLPLLLTLVALSLSGCSLLIERSSVTLFDLPAEPLISAVDAGGVSDITLRVATPGASGLLVSPRILVVPQPNQPQVYAGARWANSIPLLLRDRMIDAFQSDGRLPRLIHAESMVTADVELISNLRTFHSEYTSGSPESVIRLDVRLVDASSQRLIAGQRFTQHQPASSEAIPDVIAAFGAASDELMRELVGWTVVQLEAH